MKEPEEKSEEDRGLLTDDAAVDRYLCFLAGGLFGVMMSFIISAVAALVLESLGLVR